jgi:hypothetical protein
MLILYYCKLLDSYAVFTYPFTYPLNITQEQGGGGRKREGVPRRLTSL